VDLMTRLILAVLAAAAGWFVAQKLLFGTPGFTPAFLNFVRAVGILDLPAYIAMGAGALCFLMVARGFRKRPPGPPRE
jgi:hypothetical protein